MKRIYQNNLFLIKIIAACLLGFIAIVLSGLIYKVIPIKIYFPFVAEVLLILVTWILYKWDGENLNRIGFDFSFKNAIFLFIGLAIGIVALGIATYLRSVYTGERWHFSTGVNVTLLLKSLYYTLPTVMVQELMFRGYLFTKTIDKFGVAKANIIFCFLFMLVHVLDYEVLNNPTKLIMLAITIPVGHLLFATALLKSKTLWFPIGLHWGNNWAVGHLAGVSNSESFIFYTTDQKIYTTWLPLVILLLIFNVFYLLVTYLIWKWKGSLILK